MMCPVSLSFWIPDSLTQTKVLLFAVPFVSRTFLSSHLGHRLISDCLFPYCIVSLLGAESTSLYLGSTNPSEDEDIFNVVATIFLARSVCLKFHMHGSFCVLANERGRLFVCFV